MGECERGKHLPCFCKILATPSGEVKNIAPFQRTTCTRSAVTHSYSFRVAAISAAMKQYWEKRNALPSIANRHSRDEFLRVHSAMCSAALSCHERMTNSHLSRKLQ